MRPLTEEETKTLFAKLASYIGRNIAHLIDRTDDPHVFRLHKDRVYYVSQHIANLATSLPRQNLLSLGTCLGKFSKSGKFRLHVTALDFMAQHATYKVWVKPNGEMPFLYGNHVLKAHIGRITQDTPEHQGVVVFSMSDIPLVRLYPGQTDLGIWSYCEIDDGFTEIGADCYRCFSSGGCWVVFTGGGYHVLDHCITISIPLYDECESEVYRFASDGLHCCWISCRTRYLKRIWSETGLRRSGIRKVPMKGGRR
jgi:60S ribosome subunit biogenesis protein NIP7